MFIPQDKTKFCHITWVIFKFSCIMSSFCVLAEKILIAKDNYLTTS